MGIKQGVGAGLAIALACAAPAGASTIKVTEPSDLYDSGGKCSLREAITAANTDTAGRGCRAGTGSHDLITIRNKNVSLDREGPAAINDDNVDGDFDIHEGVTIRGTGLFGAGISGNSFDRIFDIKGVPGGQRVTIERLDIDSAQAADDLSGGAIRTTADTLIRKLSIHAALSTQSGGAVAAIAPGRLRMDNVTTNFTIAGDDGGSIYTAVPTRLRNLTILDGLADDPEEPGGTGTGGGIYRSGAEPFSIKNSIVAWNHDDSAANDCGGTFPSAGHNLIRTTSGCAYSAGPGDITGKAPGLASTPDLFGGGVSVNRLLTGSPAINHGKGCVSTDARGAPRRLGGKRCDIGAYERIRCGGVLVNAVGTPGRDVFGPASGSQGILGLGGKDVIRGGRGNDGLCGGAGRDKLFGGPGNDHLIGGAGRDKLVGGPGRDVERQ